MGDARTRFIIFFLGKIEPPIHTEYFLSGGAMTLIFIVDGASQKV
jgi:hypothetical protein